MRRDLNEEWCDIDKLIWVSLCAVRVPGGPGGAGGHDQLMDQLFGRAGGGLSAGGKRTGDVYVAFRLQVWIYGNNCHGGKPRGVVLLAGLAEGRPAGTGSKIANDGNEWCGGGRAARRQRGEENPFRIRFIDRGCRSWCGTRDRHSVPVSCSKMKPTLFGSFYFAAWERPGPLSWPVAKNDNSESQFPRSNRKPPCS